MTSQQTTDQNSIVALLPRGFRTTAEVLAAIPPERLDAPSPCAEWTVRQAANHLVGGADLFARIAEGRDIDPAEFEPSDGPEPDVLGDDPAGAYRAATARCAAAFARPGVLDELLPFPGGPAPGLVIANVCLSESLLHGWDLARGAGLEYAPDHAVVAAVTAFGADDDGEQGRANGMYGPVPPTPPGASPFTLLLASRGRTA